MTKFKFCGLTRCEDIAAANRIRPDFIGFVFWEKSKRYLTAQKAAELKKMLSPEIKAVGVFVNESIMKIAELANSGIIDIIQLHGDESDGYIAELKKITSVPIIKAFKIKTNDDIIKAEKSAADYILLDSGMGSGNVFNWEIIGNIKRPYFLAGGLNTENIAAAVKKLHPYAADLSSGIETGGLKDKNKMEKIADIVRKENTL